VNVGETLTRWTWLREAEDSRLPATAVCKTAMGPVWRRVEDSWVEGMVVADMVVGRAWDRAGSSREQEDGTPGREPVDSR